MPVAYPKKPGMVVKSCSSSRIRFPMMKISERDFPPQVIGIGRRPALAVVPGTDPKITLLVEIYRPAGMLAARAWVIFIRIFSVAMSSSPPAKVNRDTRQSAVVLI